MERERVSSREETVSVCNRERQRERKRQGESLRAVARVKKRESAHKRERSKNLMIQIREGRERASE